MEMCGYYLPLEIVEHILYLVPPKEAVICSNVCVVWKQIIENDDFWKRRCCDIGYNLRDKNMFVQDTGIDSWREFFWCDFNWRNNRFVYKTIAKEKSSDYFDNSQLLLSGTLLFFATKDIIEIWDIEGDPKIKQELQVVISEKEWTVFLRVSINFVVYERGGMIHIYSKRLNEFKFEKIVFLGSEPTCNKKSKLLFKEYTDIKAAVHLSTSPQSRFVSEMSLNDDKLAVSVVSLSESRSRCDIAYVFCLDSWNSYKINLPDHCDEIKLVWPRLYVFQDSCYGLNGTKTIHVFNVCNSSRIMALKQPISSVGSFGYSIGEEFIVGSSLKQIEVSEVLFNVWRNVDGKHIYSVREEQDSERIIRGQSFIIDKLVLFRVDKRIVLTDPVKGVRLKQFNLDIEYGEVSLLNRNYLLVLSNGALDVWDVNTGRKLYTALGNNYIQSSSMDECARNNFLYYCFLTENVFDIVAIFDFREIIPVYL